MDRRGNVIARADENGNVFTNGFDGLDRPKVAAGPAIVTVTAYQLGNPPSGPTYYSTNVLQQASTNFFDVAGRSVTNLNALGEKTVTTFDAIQRQTSRKTYNSGGSLAHETYFGYSPDHNSVTVTNGSGATAIVTTNQPHANARDRKLNPGLYYVRLFMNLLLASVLTFFLLHTILWLIRSRYQQLKNKNGNGGKNA